MHALARARRRACADRCDASVGLAALSDLLEKDGPLDAVIGPGCSSECESTAFLTSGRNLPQISYSCNSPLLSDSVKYPTFVRTTSSYASWAPALFALISWARWGTIVIISLMDNVFSLAASAYQDYFTKRSVVVALDMRLPRDQFEAFDPKDLRKVVESRVRVVLVLSYPEVPTAAAGL